MPLLSKIADALRSATTIVNVSAAAAPTNGQVLTATGGTTATWQAAGGVSADQLQIVTVSLSSAQLTTLNSSPITAIAAPGAGKVIVVDEVLGAFTYGGTQYTGFGNTELQEETSFTSISQALSAANIKGTVDVNQSNFAITGVTLVVNKAILLRNGTGDYAAGNGTAKFFIRYRTITL